MNRGRLFPPFPDELTSRILNLLRYPDPKDTRAKWRPPGYGHPLLALSHASKALAFVAIPMLISIRKLDQKRYVNYFACDRAGQQDQGKTIEADAGEKADETLANIDGIEVDKTDIPRKEVYGELYDEEDDDYLDVYVSDNDKDGGLRIHPVTHAKLRILTLAIICGIYKSFTGVYVTFRYKHTIKEGTPAQENVSAADFGLQKREEEAEGRARSQRRWPVVEAFRRFISKLNHVPDVGLYFGCRGEDEVSIDDSVSIISLLEDLRTKARANELYVLGPLLALVPQDAELPLVGDNSPSPCTLTILLIRHPILFCPALQPWTTTILFPSLSHVVKLSLQFEERNFEPHLSCLGLISSPVLQSFELSLNKKTCDYREIVLFLNRHPTIEELTLDLRGDKVTQDQYKGDSFHLPSLSNVDISPSFLPYLWSFADQTQRFWWLTIRSSREDFPTIIEPFLDRLCDIHNSSTCSVHFKVPNEYEFRLEFYIRSEERRKQQLVANHGGSEVTVVG